MLSGQNLVKIYVIRANASEADIERGIENLARVFLLPLIDIRYKAI